MPRYADQGGAPKPQRESLRHRVYELLEVGRGDDKSSDLIDNFLILLILANVVAFTLETVPEISAQYGGWLQAFDAISVLIFTLEYGLRLWSCVEVPFLRRMNPWTARWRFATRPYMLIDLAAILPFYLHVLFPIDLRVLRILRLLRFFKLARYSPAMHTLVRVLINERRALMGAMLLMVAMLLFSATGIYYLEHQVQPDKFGSVPQSAWWAMATLTTVGYGDVAPITPAGKIFGGLVMICGLGMFALPIAIISTGFSQEVARREFVVTWSLLSRIPLFAELEAQSVAGIMPYLHAHTFPPYWEVIHPGDPGSAMYFIASGKVAAKRDGRDVELKTGDFFGEVAMLDDHPHALGFTTVSRARLLRLNREDFIRLEREHPEIGDHVREVAAARMIAREKGQPEPRGVHEIESALRVEE